MARNWIDAEPIDRESKHTLNFYLREVQKFYLTPAEHESAKQWVNLYTAHRPTAKLVPKTVLEKSYLLFQRELPENTKNTEESPLLQRFVLPLRQGWVERIERKKRPTWQEFNFGITHTTANLEDARIITPERAEIELFEEEVLRWRWGGFRLRGNFYTALQQQVEQSGQEWNEGIGFFKKVEHVVVRKVQKRAEEESGETVWKICFDLL